MAKLHPPFIEGKLPAFTKNEFKIPLSMNKAVSQNEVKSINAIIKSVQTGIVKATFTDGELTSDGYASFKNIDVSNFVLGQYYKVQIAYVDKTGEVGYYSSVGIIKYSAKPEISLEGLGDNEATSGDFTGVYNQTNGDPTEKIYSYRFDIIDNNDNIIATSGEQLHNSSEDEESNITKDTWRYTREIGEDQIYYVSYSITTMNGLQVSKKERIRKPETIDANIPMILTADMNFDDGCVTLTLLPIKTSTEANAIITGSFVLTRASSLEDFKNWEDIYKFTYENVNLTKLGSITLWEDYTVQQGVEYQYAIQMYNAHNLYSTKIYNVNNIEERAKERIYVDFEDAFLSDADRQLKIRFNPKVASFKNTILESKLDTIGGRYPFIFRNGNVHYKEFSISGLISMLSDPNEKFLKGIQSTNDFPNRIGTPSMDNPPTSLDTMVTANNMYRERTFKMEVLEWLNNGKPKIFRSSAEGNFVVRLMNVSLTPNDTVGRMLHTFQATAYEVSDFNLSNLEKLELIKIEAKSLNTLKIGQVKINHVLNTDNATTERYHYGEIFGWNRDKQILTMKKTLRYAEILNAPTHLTIKLTFANGDTPSIEVGGTGSYIIPIDKNNKLNRITLENINNDIYHKGWGDTLFRFSYESSEPRNTFDAIDKITSTYEIRQHIGTNFNTNLITNMNDIRVDVKEFPFLRINKRFIQPVYLKPKNPSQGQEYDIYYKKPGELDPIDRNDYNKTVIYYEINTGKYWDPNTQSYLPESPDYRFAMNCDNPIQNYIDFEGRKDLDGGKWGDTVGRIDALYNIDRMDNIYVGNGLVVDMVYCIKIKHYEVEDNDENIINAKAKWEASESGRDSEEYEAYIKALNDALKKIN